MSEITRKQRKQLDSHFECISNDLYCGEYDNATGEGFDKYLFLRDCERAFDEVTAPIEDTK